SPRRAASNLHQLVRQFVAVECAGREVLGQHRTALLDRGNEAVPCTSLLYSRDQGGDRLVPDMRRHFFVDASIRDNLGIALGDRGKDQDASAVLRVVQAWARNCCMACRCARSCWVRRGTIWKRTSGSESPSAAAMKTTSCTT